MLQAIKVGFKIPKRRLEFYQLFTQDQKAHSLIAVRDGELSIGHHGRKLTGEELSRTLDWIAISMTAIRAGCEEQE